ncbi:MAG TPA: hypothetical protein DCX03_07570 [Bacteroidales bacterium]|nr:hypothetical protein [Bacteroidales bacterium]
MNFKLKSQAFEFLVVYIFLYKNMNFTFSMFLLVYNYKKTVSHSSFLRQVQIQGKVIIKCLKIK